ncbi:MAG: hypothetical protein ThorAB25_04430 [Candidatus Thorarchaeota archaeon AB_25]|nr:MAG: hypothetical protein ThorAB25_04430 [Candidatus Thorarchaeota archaeon AB_25]
MGLGLESSEVIRAFDFYLLSSSDSPEGLRDTPVVNTEQGPAHVALKKMENGDCIFLKDNLCMIHTIRPMVCMSFPFVFWDGGDEKTWGLSAMKEICPGLGSGPEVEISDLRELADAVLEDIALFKEFAEEWNRNEENPTVEHLVDTILSDQRFTV